MPRLATTVGAISLLAASTLFSCRSSAQTAPEPIKWTYSAPAECPLAAVFAREFRVRTTRAVLVDAAPNAIRAFSVTLSSEPSRVVGRLEVDGPADAVATRDVVGQTCAGVVSALALVAALTVDPLAAESPPVAPPAPTPTPPALPAQKSPPIESAARSASRPRFTFAAGVDAGALFGLFPKLAPDLSLFAEARLERSSVLAPSVRLALSGVVSSEVYAGPGSARFHQVTATLDGCPLELRAGSGLGMTPCAFAELGVLSGAGAGVATPEVESRRWLALGAAGRLSWSFPGVFFVEVQGRIELPVRRDTFVLAVPERVVILAVPAVLGSVQLGGGVRW